MFFPGWLVRILFIGASIMALTQRTSLAAPVSFSTPQSNYTPGQDFEVMVTMPEMVGLYAYELSFQLTSASGIAGVDYLISSATPATSRYLFGSDENFAATAVTDSSSLSRMTLSDIDNALGMDIVSGTNDQVATFQISTNESFSSALELSVDTTAIYLDQSDLNAVPEYQNVVTDTASFGAITISPVTAIPEPSIPIVLLAGSVLIVGRRRRKR